MTEWCVVRHERIFFRLIYIKPLKSIIITIITTNVEWFLCIKFAEKVFFEVSKNENFDSIRGLDSFGACGICHGGDAIGRRGPW